MKNRLLLLFSLFLLLPACTPKPQQQESKRLPAVVVPKIITDPEEAIEYAEMHFWDQMDGVEVSLLEQPLVDFIAILDKLPLSKSQKAVEKMFENIVRVDAADTSKHVFTLMTEKVAKYLYDPNSPYRNEDYYYPFVKALAECPLTPEDMRTAYRYEASECARNPMGSKAPDFRIKTIKGTTFRLRDVKASFTMLFFSNPGCTACKEIIDNVQSSEKLCSMIEQKTLAVVNVYIDEDLKAWREYEPNYPASWHTGYDPGTVIRNENLYSIRAIPSLYLLDSEQKILMKDAPTEKVIYYLEHIQ